ncbi:tetratricopeptide repeat protein [Hydrogenimonas sp.]
MAALRVWALLWVLGLGLKAGWLDVWYLHKGYEAFERKDYNATVAEMKKIAPPLLESLYAQAAAYYEMGAYKKAGRLFARIKSDDPAIKRRLLYNLGNCAMKMGRYKSARDFYAKALAFGFDADTLHNLELALFMEERRKKSIGPKANRSVEAASTSGGADQRKEGAKKGRKGGTQSGGGGGSQASGVTVRKSRKLPATAVSRHPHSSKVYETINRGYVHEKRPW